MSIILFNDLLFIVYCDNIKITYIPIKKNATRLRIIFRCGHSESLNISQSFEDDIADDVCMEIDVDSKGSEFVELFGFLRVSTQSVGSIFKFGVNYLLKDSSCDNEPCSKF